MLITTGTTCPAGSSRLSGRCSGSRCARGTSGRQFGAGLKSMVGGELKGMTKALVDSRQQVIARMTEEAEAKGANAIIAMRFDTSELARTGRRSAPTEPQCGCTKPDGRGSGGHHSLPVTVTAWRTAVCSRRAGRSHARKRESPTQMLGCELVSVTKSSHRRDGVVTRDCHQVGTPALQGMAARAASWSATR